MGRADLSCEEQAVRHARRVRTHHGDGRECVWIKSAHVTQDMLVRADPKRYFVPPYVGKSGWVGAYIDRGADWEIVADLLQDAYRLTAPEEAPRAARLTRAGKVIRAGKVTCAGEVR